MSEIELILKSPTDRIAPFTIKCNISWTIKQLKEHIKNIYPLKPTVESQKVIYVGKLLKDDQVLKNLFQPESSTIVHFICQSSINETVKKADDVSKKPEITPEKCPDLYKEYQNYVSNYYAASQSQPFAAMNHYQQQMMWMMNQAYMQQYANYYAQFSSTGSDSSVPHVPSPMVTRESSVQQQQQNQDQNNERRVDAPAVGGGGGGGAAAAGENGGMQNMMAAAFGGLMGDGGEDENDGDVEPRDLLHYFYILVRFALLLLICYYYSSVASVVTTLMLFFLFFGVNLLRRNHNNRAVPAVPVGQINPAVPAATTPVVNGDRGDADRAAAATTTGNLHDQNEEAGDNNNINVSTTAAAGTSANENSPSAPQSVVVVTVETLPTITERLKRAATTSLQFVLTFFVTLFPEPIAQIDIN